MLREGEHDLVDRLVEEDLFDGVHRVVAHRDRGDHAGASSGLQSRQGAQQVLFGLVDLVVTLRVEQVQVRLRRIRNDETEAARAEHGALMHGRDELGGECGTLGDHQDPGRARVLGHGAYRAPGNLPST
jgi:hypothetical protein